MNMPQDVRLVIGPGGKPTAVLVDIVTWERIIQALEDAEDIHLARQLLTLVDAAGGDLKQADLISWEQAKRELELDDAKA